MRGWLHLFFLEKVFSWNTLVNSVILDPGKTVTKPEILYEVSPKTLQQYIPKEASGFRGQKSCKM